MNWLVKIIAIATYKGGIKKHSIIISLIFVLNPLITGLIAVFKGYFKLNVTLLEFLIFLILFYAVFTFILFKNYNWLIKGLKPGFMKDVSNLKRELCALTFFALIILSSLIAVLLSIYSYELKYN